MKSVQKKPKYKPCSSIFRALTALACIYTCIYIYIYAHVFIYCIYNVFKDIQYNIYIYICMCLCYIRIIHVHTCTYLHICIHVSIVCIYGTDAF